MSGCHPVLWACRKQAQGLIARRGASLGGSVDIRQRSSTAMQLNWLRDGEMEERDQRLVGDEGDDSRGRGLLRSALGFM